ncbi:MAG: MBL fold metallo-hydrolase [Pseudomonadota bacterium]
MSRRYQIGDVEVTRVRETLLPDFAGDFLFPDWHGAVAGEGREWLVPGSVNQARSGVNISIHTWVLKTPHHTLLIDTGIGNGRERRIAQFNRLDNPYLERLAAAGVMPHEVDFVLCTHLHSDHVGWNTRLQGERWVPTFPNARYVFPSDELTYSQSPAFRDGYAAGVYEDSIAPILEAGLVDLIGPQGGEFHDGLAFHPTPGHTPGHMSISLVSKGRRALFTGDVVHSPLQIYHPHWNSAFCEEQDAARVSRRWAIEHAAEHRALFLTAHFPESSAGYISSQGGKFDWHFA